MKKRFTEEQIVRVLEEGQGGSIDELCRKHGISRPTYYSWKSKYKGMGVPDVKRLKTLEAENSRLNSGLSNSLGHNIPPGIWRDSLKLVHYQIKANSSCGGPGWFGGTYFC